MEDLDPIACMLTSQTRDQEFPKPVKLAGFHPSDFDRGAGVIKEALWLIIRLVLFQLCPFSFSALKRAVLRSFGARIGRGVILKPQVKITFPWKLEVGDSVWLGEECWILNLERVVIGSNVCISQRAFLCTGSHNYKLPTFDLIVKPITIEDGAWLGAASWVGPGVTVGSHAVLSAGSVATKNLEAWGVYQGNPAEWVKARNNRTADRGLSFSSAISPSDKAQVKTQPSAER
jgi:putative colanic acid biosynthesis acetyltransferase WcaF